VLIDTVSLATNDCLTWWSILEQNLESSMSPESYFRACTWDEFGARTYSHSLRRTPTRSWTDWVVKQRVRTRRWCLHEMPRLPSSPTFAESCLAHVSTTRSEENWA